MLSKEKVYDVMSIARAFALMCAELVNLKRVLLISFFLSVCLIFSAHSSSTSLNSPQNYLDPTFESPRFLHVDTATGLSQNTIYDVNIDDFGFVYIATEEGLDRFDGHEVIRIKGDNSQFVSNPIYKVFQDSDDLLWISTGLSGVYSFNLETSETIQVFASPYKNDPLWMQYAEDVNEDNQGNIIIAANHEVVMYDKVSKQTKTLFELNEEQVMNANNIRIALKVNNFLIIGTDQGMYAKDLLTQKVELIDFLPTENDAYGNSTNVKQLVLRPDGKLWIGTVKGIYETTLANIQQHLVNDLDLAPASVIDNTMNVWRIEKTSENSVFVGSDKGLFNYHVEDKKMELLLLPRKEQEELTDKSVTALDVDKEGNVWFGTMMSGAMFWSPDSAAFTSIYNRVTTPKEKKLSSNVILSLLEASNNILWAGSNNGLNQIDLNTGSVKHFFKSEYLGSRYEESYIQNVVELSNGELLIATGDGLRLFDPSTEKVRGFGAENSESRALYEEFSWALVKESDNVVWSLDEYGYLIRLDFEDETATRIEVSGIAYNSSTFFDLLGYDIRTSQLLISSAGQLLGLNTKTNEVSVIHSILGDNATLNMTATSWIRDGKNNFWLSYAGRGLFQLNGSTFEVINEYSSANLLPSNLVYDLSLDYQNNIWFSSHSGLHEFDTDNNIVATYQYMQGVSSSEFNSGARAKSRDGRLAYGSSKGLVLFSPMEVSHLAKQSEQTPAITQISLYSRDILLPYVNLNNTNIELEHDDLGLSINVSSLDYTAVANDRFFYRLISDGKVINFPKAITNRIELSRLPPGEHTLEIFRQTGSSANFTPARLQIKVNYAPWMSPIAITTYFVVFALLLGLYIAHRNKTQKVLASANQKISIYNNRLRNALKASNSDIWEWSSDSKMVTSKRTELELGYDNLNGSIAFEKHLSLIHELDRLQYLSAWRQFIRGEVEQFDITYRMLHKSGHHIWFRDAGSISGKQNGIINVTGTYSNVTDNMASKERLKLFGDAFKHTRDWVIILDRNKTPLGANPSFYKAFSLDENRELGKQVAQLLPKIGEVRHTLRSRLGSLKPGERWKSEVDFPLKNGLMSTITDINAIADEDDDRLVEYYLVIMTDITEQKEAQASLERLANFDTLTGLINRPMLIERLQRAILFARRHSTSLATVFIDLDRFKPINDTFGHEAGDAVIVEIARRIQSVLRSSDVVSRIGGDEFVVVIEEVHSITEVNRLVSKLLLEIEKPIQLSSQPVSVSGSAGISMYPNDANDAETLLRNADVAMYSAKETGKNKYQHFTEQMNEKVQQDMMLQNKIKVAVSRNEFENYYQPIIDIRTQRTAGFEMLLRWQSNNQFISPGTFIPVAEQIGLITQMTLQAIERTVIDIAKWYVNGFTGYVAINLSAKQFSSRPDFEYIVSLLKEYQLPNDCLRFEITEGLLIDNNDNTLDYMNEMRSLGFKISLDDFGTGYSSLRYLKDFPIDVLKIDKSFVDDIGVDKATESIITSTIFMTEMLKMDTVAEGIETLQQVNYFIKTSCRYLQGFYFSKPLPHEKCYQLFQKEWLFGDDIKNNSSAHKTTSK